MSDQLVAISKKLLAELPVRIYSTAIEDIPTERLKELQIAVKNEMAKRERESRAAAKSKKPKRQRPFGYEKGIPIHIFQPAEDLLRAFRGNDRHAIWLKHNKAFGFIQVTSKYRLATKDKGNTWRLVSMETYHRDYTVR